MINLNGKIYALAKWKIHQILCDAGFTDFYNYACPESRFYTKKIGDITIYVRSDYSYNGRNGFWSYETWIRDNTKSAFDKSRDSGNRYYKTMADVDNLLEFINQFV